MPTITTVVSRLQQQLLTLTSILLLSALCSLLSALTLHLILSPISLPHHCHSTTSPPSPQSPIFHHILPRLGQLPVSCQLPAAPRPTASPVATLLPKARNTPGSVTGTALHCTALRCTAPHCTVPSPKLRCRGCYSQLSQNSLPGVFTCHLYSQLSKNSLLDEITSCL